MNDSRHPSLSQPDPESGSNSAASLALRPKEAALALGISPRLLWTLTKAGKIPHVRLNRVVVYPVAQLSEFLRKKADESNAPEA